MFIENVYSANLNKFKVEFTDNFLKLLCKTSHCRIAINFIQMPPYFFLKKISVYIIGKFENNTKTYLANYELLAIAIKFPEI